MIADLKNKKPSQWYSSLKRLGNFDQQKSESINIEEIGQFTDQQQSELIADQFTSIPNQYNQLCKDDIQIPPFSDSDIHQFHPSHVWLKLAQLQTNKFTVS